MSSPSARSKLYDWLFRHGVACFVLMTLAFVVFGLLSLDLVRLVSANAGFLWRAGWDGIVEGGLMQMLELVASALVAIASYLVFKLCEQVLIQRLAQGRR